MLLLQFLPVLEMIGQVLTRGCATLASWWRRALQSKELTQGWPFLAPGGRLAVIRNVESLALSACVWVQRAVDREASDDVL